MSHTGTPFSLFQPLNKETFLLLGSVSQETEFRQLAVNLQQTLRPSTNLEAAQNYPQHWTLISISLRSPHTRWDCHDWEGVSRGRRWETVLSSSCESLLTSSPGKQESPIQLLRLTGLGDDCEAPRKKRRREEQRKAWVVADMGHVRDCNLRPLGLEKTLALERWQTSYPHQHTVQKAGKAFFWSMCRC